MCVISDAYVNARNCNVEVKFIAWHETMYLIRENFAVAFKLFIIKIETQQVLETIKTGFKNRNAAAIFQ